MNSNESLPAQLEQISPATVPWLMISGLLAVTVAQFVPMMPVMTGVATLMLGSTLAVQIRVPPQLRLLAMSVNLLVYLLLYALFLGAVIHQTTLSIPLAPAWFRLTDLGASIWLVILSLQVGVRQIQAAI